MSTNNLFTWVSKGENGPGQDNAHQIALGKVLFCWLMKTKLPWKFQAHLSPLLSTGLAPTEKGSPYWEPAEMSLSQFLCFLSKKDQSKTTPVI